MSISWLNGRRAMSWEIPAVERGRRDARERDLGVLGGLLAEYPAVPRAEEPRRRVVDVDTGWLA